MRMKRHIVTNIAGILKQPNSMLARLFDMNGKEAREELLRLQAMGHKYIPSEGCEGFDPINGCPGHPVPEPPSN